MSTYDPQGSSIYSKYITGFFEKLVDNEDMVAPAKYSKDYAVSVKCVSCKCPIKLLILHHPFFWETFIGKESEPEARRVEYCLVMQKLGLFFQFFFKHYLNNLDYFEKFFKYFLTSFPKVSCFEWLLLQYHLGNLEIFKEEGGGYKLIFCTFTEFNLKKLNRCFENVSIYDLLINFGITRVLNLYMSEEI